MEAFPMQTNIVKNVTMAPLRHASQRSGIIGGSQVGLLAGYEGCYSSEFAVYQSYIGVPEVPTEEMLDAFEAGNNLEPVIADWFSKDFGVKASDELQFQYVDPDESRLVLHPDREFIGPDGKRYGLECKTASAFAMLKGHWPEQKGAVPMANIPSWVPVTKPDGIRALKVYDGSQYVLPGYYAQCLWYMALAGYDGVFLARLTDNRMTYYFIEPNLKREQFLYDSARKWLAKVDNGYVPPCVTLDQVRTKYPKAEDKKVYIADDAFVEKINDLIELTDQGKELDERIESIKASLGEKMEDCEIAKDADGNKLCTFKSTNTTRFDTTSFKKDHADLYEAYAKKSETARSFRLS
jgi:predicted phage-related endonuclease